MPDAHPERAIQRALAVTSPLLKGPDIKVLQASINKVLKGYDLNGRLKEDGEFGERTAALGDKAAYALGLEAAGDSPHHISRIVTQDEQKAIRNPASRTDAQKERSKRRVKELHDREAEQASPASVRSQIIAYCKWGVANEPSIHYAQIRPYPSVLQGLPMHTDCSGFATLAYKSAGAPDPNGRGYDGYGYTGTMLQACRHIGKTEAQPGDLVVYGNFPGTHVVVVAENRDYCYSHGQEAGPLYISLAAEASAHSGQSINYLSIL